MDIFHLPRSEGGQGLWMPKVYLKTAHTSSFWRLLQQPTRFGLLQRNVLRNWLHYKGIIHGIFELLLLQLSSCAI